MASASSCFSFRVDGVRVARPEPAKELRLQQAKSTVTGWHGWHGLYALSLRRACGPTEVVINQPDLVPSHHAPRRVTQLRWVAFERNSHALRKASERATLKLELDAPLG